MRTFEWSLPVKMPLRRLLSLVAGWSAMACGQAQSQSIVTYPTKPVRFVCVTAPGGGLDVIGRIVADRLSRSLGHESNVRRVP
jgi:tripartite-type tricarboxylate transporter receptor subunit TctC